MAIEFVPPFAHEAEALREPTVQETSGGFECGPADQGLFNRLFNRIEANLGEVVSFAGVTPSAPGLALREAIEALIAVATGGGDTSQFVLISQARARLPIFPEVLTVDGLMPVVSPGVGVVRVAAGTNFLHRGIFPLVTAQTDLVAAASKTYHLRWNPVDGFTLKDLSSGSYNPTLLADGDVLFDTTYDDMLVARVTTNSGNVVSIQQLVNKNRLADMKSAGTSAGITNTGAPGWQYNKTFEVFHNWARRPTMVVPQAHLNSQIVAVGSSGLQGGANVTSLDSNDRYKVVFTVSSDFDSPQSNPFAGYLLNIGA